MKPAAGLAVPAGPECAGPERAGADCAGPVDRALAANVLGATVLALADRIRTGTASVARHGANGPAALVTLLWYPGRSVGFLAGRLRISHPGAVQLADRLERDGLVRRTDGPDGRTRLLSLTAVGTTTARAVLAERSAVLDRAVDLLDDVQIRALQTAAGTILENLTDDLATSEFLCRLCDEGSCPDALCPVERAEPTPPGRRGTGHTVADSADATAPSEPGPSEPGGS